tara:strand:+ start:189 stop:383 length:195 start_codon:yes stop_codon:yes gene_type:complete
MANMSYCRFENTARDLRDCVKALQNNETEDLSTYEKRGLQELLTYAHDVVYMEDYINEILEENE